MKSKFLVLAMVATIQLVHSAALIQEDGHESSQITITKLGGGNQRVDFSEADTVGQLKAKISQVDGTPSSNLILVFAGKQLNDDSKLLTDYGIQQESKVIYLQRPEKQQQQQQAKQETKLSTNEGASASLGTGGDVHEPKSKSDIGNLFVRAPTGEVFEVPADAELTVGQFKRVISILLNVPAESIQLAFNGASLEDPKLLPECGLREGSTVNLTIDMATVQAQGVVLERVIKRIIASLVVKINNDGQPRTKLSFKHDSHFTELELVLRMIGERILSDFQRDQGQTPLVLDAYKSEDLRVEFGYEFRGERKTTLANLNDGAHWVVEQAKAAESVESKESDLSESEIFGESPTTTAPQ